MKNRFLYSLIFCLSLILGTPAQSITTEGVFAKYPHTYFIESGSWVGDGIQMAINAGFKNIYSIELGEKPYQICCKRFSGVKQVHLFHGDSSKLLSKILADIDAPATFWLDGHYSGTGTARGSSNTPLLAELEAIRQHPIKTHTILIDDVRQFGTVDFDFISLDTIKKKVLEINPRYQFKFENGYVRNDILVAYVIN